MTAILTDYEVKQGGKVFKEIMAMTTSSTNPPVAL